MKKLILLCSVILFFFACKKEETMSSTPKISWESYGPGQIQALQDSIYFSISYEDLEGDLGSTNPDDKNLFITDDRFPLTYEMRIPEIVPNGQSASIKGTLNFSLANTVLKGQNDEEAVTFSITIVDRAGNTSNELKTQGLKVIK